MRYALSLLVLVVAGCATRPPCCDRPEASNEQIARAAFDAVGHGRYDEFDRYIASDYVRHCQATPGLVVENLDQFKAFIRADRAGVPDQSLTIKHMVAQGDLVAFYATYTGTHTGQWGPFAPTGRTISLDFAGVHRIENGKIAETWITWDNLAVLTQLGLQPSTP